jgi:signal transduction histidine kinase
MGASGPKVVEPAHQTPQRVSLQGWPLRWKVAAIMVLPVVLAAMFGALRIQNELSAASKLSVASVNAGVVVPAVEFVERLNGLALAAASGAAIAEPLAQFDASAADLASLITSAEFDPAVVADLTTASATARSLRDEIASGLVPQQQIAEQADDVAAEAASAITTATAAVDDSAVRVLADRLVDVLAAQRALTSQQILVAAPDFADSVVLRTKAAQAAGAEAAAIDRPDQLTQTGDDADLRAASDGRRHAYSRPLGEPVNTTQVADAMEASADDYFATAQQLSTDLDRTVHDRANALRSAALRDTAIILGAVLIALVVALGVGRSLIRSIAGLRRGAMQVARVQLPEEIERLSKGEGVPDIKALPVHTNEEVGQLARAIDDIHFQAVRLAGEHGVRLQIGEMFETLSRRSRSLVEEQLELIETLELDEDDPVRLDHLFRLDHLVTRMRRNGDNLLVLADTVERQRRAEPTPLPEVLRAAMSEVEEYRRVKIGPAVDVWIVGAAAGDIGHLIAELLDNALRYSPPDSSVTVTVSRAVDAGVLVEVADRGLGMSEEDVRAANDRLAVGGEVTSETAKRMGLFVVGRLARRHDVTVRLRTTDRLSDRPGVTASVHLPGVLIAPPAGAFTEAPARSTGQRLAPEPGLWSTFDAGPADVPVDDDSPATTLTSEPDAPARNGNVLPKRSPGASGVNKVAGQPDERMAASPAASAAAAEPHPAPQPASKAFAYFTNRPAPEDPPRSASAATEAAEPSIQSDGSPIYERMVSEWLLDPTTLASSEREWATAADVGWTAAAKAVEEKPQRHTDSGLPIRERGARLVPGHANNGSDLGADMGRDPTAVGNMLSRAMAGVRSGRAERNGAHRRIEGDE